MRKPPNAYQGVAGVLPKGKTSIAIKATRSSLSGKTFANAALIEMRPCTS